jgi:outer membrane usher protein
MLMGSLILLAAVPAALASDGDRTLMLEVWVNGRTQHTIISVIRHGDAILLQPDALAAAGILGRPGAPQQDIDTRTMPNMQFRIDEADQKLVITAPDAGLVPQSFELRPDAAAPHAAASATGFVLGYDTELTVGEQPGAVSGGATLSATGFSRFGVLRQTGFTTADTHHARATRLDTSFEFDDPDSLRRWSAGDIVSGGLVWTRPVRFAGLQLATDYSLQPDVPTLALPSFFGTTSVPTTVDVYVGAARVLNTQVDPGPFQARNLPIVTGSNEATIVTRDVLGRETTLTIPFFASTSLLRQGLFDYSMEMGVLRNAYGLESFNYGDPFSEGTVRYGLTNEITAEAHAEASRRAAVAGGGLSYGLSFGVLRGSFAGSGGPQGSGGLVSLSFETQHDRFNLFATGTAASRHYSDISISDGLPPPRLRVQIGSSLSFGRYGSLAESLVATDDGNGNRSHLANATYSLSLGGGWFFGTTGLYDQTHNSWSIQSFLSVPLGGATLASATARTDGHGYDLETSVYRAADPDGGLGYSLTAGAGDTTRLEADGAWVTDTVNLNGGVSMVGGQTAGRVGVAGSLIDIDNSLFAARQTGDAFALVRTGQPHTPVYRENRPVAVSDSNGEALLTSLNAYTGNRISIDPLDYPMNTLITEDRRVVVPRRGSGMLVDLAPANGKPAMITVTLPEGGFAPAGVRVTMAGTPPTIVGREGQVFIADLPRTVVAVIDLPDGGHCRFTAVPPAIRPAEEIPQIGPVACARGAP